MIGITLLALGRICMMRPIFIPSLLHSMPMKSRGQAGVWGVDPQQVMVNVADHHFQTAKRSSVPVSTQLRWAAAPVTS